jgi:hypothetical protein
MNNNIEIIIKKINKKPSDNMFIVENKNLQEVKIDPEYKEEEIVFNFGKNKKKKKKEMKKEMQKDSKETQKDSKEEEELELLRTINGYILLQSDPIKIPIKNSLYEKDYFDRIEHNICSSHN